MTDVDGMSGLLALGALAASVMTATVLSVGAMMRTSLGARPRVLRRLPIGQRKRRPREAVHARSPRVVPAAGAPGPTVRRDPRSARVTVQPASPYTQVVRCAARRPAVPPPMTALA